MRVTLRYFAVLRELRGADREEIELPEGTTAGEAYRRSGCPVDLPVGFAVNTAFVKAGAVLADGDELAFLPPLGGG